MRVCDSAEYLYIWKVRSGIQKPNHCYAFNSLIYIYVVSNKRLSLGLTGLASPLVRLGSMGSVSSHGIVVVFWLSLNEYKLGTVRQCAVSRSPKSNAR